MNLPFENACSSRGSLGLWNVPRVLQRDGESRVRQRIVRRKRRERESRGDGLFDLPGIAQRPHQPMMRLSVRRVQLNGRTKGLGCIVRRTGSEQFHSVL